MNLVLRSRSKSVLMTLMHTTNSCFFFFFFFFFFFPFFFFFFFFVRISPYFSDLSLSSIPPLSSVTLRFISLLHLFILFLFGFHFNLLLIFIS